MGVLLGASISVGWAALLERRRVSRDARTAARLIGDDLFLFSTASNMALDAGSWLPFSTMRLTELDRWRRHDVLLAGLLRHQEWRLIRVTMRRVEMTIAIAARLSAQALDERDRLHVKEAGASAMDCYVMFDEISKFGYHSRKRRRVTREHLTSRIRDMHDNLMATWQTEAPPPP
ncbi:hypothetical protein [Conexibacter arvalis]|uniref:Uncharacterized protein n=1 Tax=Conexibacter arvalis TaxID=912552 RepID=A0A840IB12_9ACTN|nr:hypothetical protein [Conexibacter arvalis]MBB4661433.1 hypothetical protein [Conexibacter arvalis]